MTAVATPVALAVDPALPQRDRLLDPAYVGAHLAELLAVGDRLDVCACELGRVKYRLGESLRVTYRLHLPDGVRTVSARAFADPSIAATAAGDRQALGAVWSAAHDAANAAAWWTFPADRRLRHLDAVLRPGGRLADLPAGRWVTSEVAAYAPERAVTVRALAADGAVLGYAKAYRHAADAVAAVELYRGLGAALADAASTVRLPGVLAADAERGIVVLEPLPGRRWDELDGAGVARLLPRLAAAVAHVHRAPVPPSAPRFTRLDPSLVVEACRLVAVARPDAAAACDRLATRLADGCGDAGPSVLLHGDLHPTNALLDGGRVSLIDADQAGHGPAAVDLGSLLARVGYGALLGEYDGAAAAGLGRELLAAYAAVTPPPSPESLRWHVAAALVVERAGRAITRLNPRGLAVLTDTLTAAERCLDREDLPW